MVTWTCEISGEPLSEDVVVTPSGHVCQRKLLLQKLSENGGLDPFVDDTPLAESDLIALVDKSIIPPRTSNSLNSTISDLQSQYDAILLELFDTRKLLTETRQELSSALYQNDAAVRVIARISMERDQAREQLKNWNAAGGAPTTAVSADEPAQKKTKLSSVVIPEADHKQMLDTWEKLQPTRKASQKELAKSALTPEQLTNLNLKTPKSKVSATPSSLSTANSELLQVCDNSLVTYSHGKKSWSAKSISLSDVGTCSDVSDTVGICGLESGGVDIVDLESKSIKSTITANNGKIVNVRLHPDGAHFVAASESGVVTVGSLVAAEIVASFPSQNTYTTGALHPDGLIFVAGDASGNLTLWDFKSQGLAATLEGDSAVTSIDISGNGYHIGVAYENGDVKVWDLRKQSVVGTLNQDKEITKVTSVKFDRAGKYLAYAGDGLTVKIVTAKKWDEVATLNAPKLDAHAGLQWGDAWIAASGMEKKTAKVAIFEG